MDKYLVTKRSFLSSWVFITSVLLSVVMSGCVTQDYDNDNTPVVQNQANRNDMAATRVSLGLGYLRMGNMPQAKQNLEKAKNFAPDMVQVYTAFAHYYETVGEHKLTIESYEKALSIQSDDADTLNNYGVYLCRQDQVDEAEKQFLKAIAVPTYILVSKSYENLSACFLQKDDFAKSDIYLNKAILHSPSSASTLFQMVRLQYAMGDFQQAKQFSQRFEKATRRFTSQSLALSYKVYWKLGQRNTAKNYATMLVKMYPQSWEAKQYLLNELELIEADNLAKRYKATQENDLSAKPKKRIVKLSPKKNSSVNTEPTLTTQAPETENSTKELNLSTSKPVQAAASSTSINAALTAKPVVVLSGPTTVQSAITAESTVVIKKEIPLVDTEIFQVAKKPTPIIENSTARVVETEVTEKAASKPITIVAVSVQEKLTPTKSEQPPKSEKVADKFPNFHVVKAGDTLYNLSVKYNIKIKALRRWNKFSKNRKMHIKDIIFLEDPKSVNN